MRFADMSFREKGAWVSFLAILGVFTPFFWNSWQQFSGARDRATAMSTAFGLLVLFVVVEIAAHAVLALLSPKEARTPKDERERAIEMRATTVAFQVLVVGALVAVATIHVTPSAWVMQQVLLVAIVAAELVKFGLQIAFFRRGA